MVAKELTKIDTLSSKLLSTLDESIFFGELTKFFANIIECDEIALNLVHEDNSCRLVAKNGKPVKKSARKSKGLGAAGHVIKTKRAYFSNSVSRDPIFASSEEKDINSELCVPVSVDGIIIGTIHFRIKDDSAKFKREDINTVVEVLNEVQGPLANMKMYLSAKFLNESLQKKIEEKETELTKKAGGLDLVDSYRIEEKQIVGNSQVMKDILATVDRVAATDVNVLVNGESGVGKEMIARRIHCRSVRAQRAFISVDCSMGTEDQLESEIFGREELDVIKGLRIHKGVVEAADGGTIFINNIEKMPVRLQAKLMNFVKEGIYFRAGTQSPLRSDVRVIVASSKDIQTCVEEGTFREDLSFAISTMSLRVPSLRERHEDIEVLASHFLNAGKSADSQKSMSPGVVKLLSDYHWPGNVRELHSIMERAYILSPSSIIERDHLADSIKVEKVEEEAEEVIERGFREMTLNDLEREHICRTLEHLGGNKTKTAKTLGITVKTLYNKLHSYGMIESKEA
jgi:Nif-specific regulatory protein